MEDPGDSTGAPGDGAAAASGLVGTGDLQLAQYPGAPFIASNGDLYFTTVLEGLLRYDGERFTSYTMADGLPSDMLRDLLEVDDELWVATTGGVAVFDGEAFRTLTEYAPVDVTYSMTEWGDHRDIWDLHVDRAGRTWATTMSGVFRLVEGRWERLELPVVAEPGAYEFTRRMVYGVYEDAAGDLWFQTDGAGVVRFAADLSASTVYTVATHGLVDDRVCDVLQDASGAYWFGTSGGGVSRWSGVEGEPFTAHLQLAERSMHVGLGRVMSIAEDAEGDVWFGMAQQGGGAWRWSAEGAAKAGGSEGSAMPAAGAGDALERFVPASYADVAGGAFTYFGAEHGLGGAVPSIDVDREGRLWFGTTEGVYYKEGERFVHLGKGE